MSGYSDTLGPVDDIVVDGWDGPSTVMRDFFAALLVHVIETAAPMLVALAVPLSVIFVIARVF